MKHRKYTKCTSVNSTVVKEHKVTKLYWEADGLK